MNGTKSDHPAGRGVGQLDYCASVNNLAAVKDCPYFEVTKAVLSVDPSYHFKWYASCCSLCDMNRMVVCHCEYQQVAKWADSALLM